MRSRPTKHFTPKNNWINDPNGLIYHGGYYHLYFQHNPLENKWGHMSWGHARSKDLINWEELAVAIPEQPEHMIFSGSAVFDAENNRLAAFYTAHKEGNQSQWVAFSYDGGETYKELQQALDLNLEEFRDPKVFKFQNHWIMVVVKSPQHLISFFKSTDLVNWEFLSDYRMPTIEILYECPDLFELDGTWVLFLSTNPGGRAGGSGMHYVLGNFDGRTFKESTEVRYLDYGPDYYAAVTYNDTKERISMAWMNNWDYANKLEREIWNGSMNTPRKLRVIDGQLIQTFIGATEKFVVNENNFNLIYANGKLKFKSENGKLIIDRSELWSSSLKTFDLPTTAPFNIEAIYDAESIELSINGHFVSAQLEVGPESPEIERI